jgi:hypothetical protein
MKKVFATILAIIYLATSSGAAIITHYCMGKVVSVDLEQKQKCGKCGMKNKKGCCEDRITILKVQEEHQVVSNHFLVQPDFVIVNNSYNSYSASLLPVASGNITHNNSPPGTSGAELCILHSVFKI